MKTAIIAAITLASAAVFAADAPAPVLFNEKFEGNMKLFKNPACNSLDGGGKFEFVPGGVSGKCLKVVTNAKQTLMLNLSNDIPVKTGDKLKITMMVKGKGGVESYPMGRGQKETYYLIGAHEKVSADQWEKLTFIINMKESKGREIKAFAWRMNIRPNSDLLIDDLKVEKMNK